MRYFLKPATALLFRKIKKNLEKEKSLGPLF